MDVKCPFHADEICLDGLPLEYIFEIFVKSFINSLPNAEVLDSSKLETNCRRHFKVQLK